jgi:hypothetical protein
LFCFLFDVPTPKDAQNNEPWQTTVDFCSWFAEEFKFPVTRFDVNVLKTTNPSDLVKKLNAMQICFDKGDKQGKYLILEFMEKFVTRGSFGQTVAGFSTEFVNKGNNLQAFADGVSRLLQTPKEKSKDTAIPRFTMVVQSSGSGKHFCFVK